MADAAAAVDEKLSAPQKAPVVPIKVLIMVVVAALVAGLGGAFVVVKLFGGSHEAATSRDDRKPDAAAKSGPQADGAGKPVAGAAPGAMFDLDPFIVNLADSPEIRYLKLTVKLEADNADVSAELSARVPQLRDSILVLLSSKDSATIRTPQGKFQLRDEITQRVNGLLPKPGVRSAYFTDFVVQ